MVIEGRTDRTRLRDEIRIFTGVPRNRQTVDKWVEKVGGGIWPAIES